MKSSKLPLRRLFGLFNAVGDCFNFPEVGRIEGNDFMEFLQRKSADDNRLGFLSCHGFSCGGCVFVAGIKSGREDSNLRPPAPEAGALTGLRYAPFLYLIIPLLLSIVKLISKVADINANSIPSATRLLLKVSPAELLSAIPTFQDALLVLISGIRI